MIQREGLSLSTRRELSCWLEVRREENGGGEGWKWTKRCPYASSVDYDDCGNDDVVGSSFHNGSRRSRSSNDSGGE